MSICVPSAVLAADLVTFESLNLTVKSCPSSPAPGITTSPLDGAFSLGACITTSSIDADSSSELAALDFPVKLIGISIGFSSLISPLAFKDTTSSLSFSMFLISPVTVSFSLSKFISTFSGFIIGVVLTTTGSFLTLSILLCT